MIPQALKTSMKSGVESDWNTVDSEISEKLNEISSLGGKIVILSSTIIKPDYRKKSNCRFFK